MPGDEAEEGEPAEGELDAAAAKKRDATKVSARGPNMWLTRDTLAGCWR